MIMLPIKGKSFSILQRASLIKKQKQGFTSTLFSRGEYFFRKRRMLALPKPGLCSKERVWLFGAVCMRRQGRYCCNIQFQYLLRPWIYSEPYRGIAIIQSKHKPCLIQTKRLSPEGRDVAEGEIVVGDCSWDHAPARRQTSHLPQHHTCIDECMAAICCA